MSTVKLTTFGIYKVVGKSGAGWRIDTLFGCTSAKLSDAGLFELEAESAPFHADSFKSKAPKDGKGLLMLYGNQDSLEEMHYWRTRARELGAEFASAVFEFDVGDIEVGLTDRELLSKTDGRNRFLNLRRMRAPLQLDVLKAFQKYVDDERPGASEKEMARVAQISTRPDLFDKLLQDDIELSRLDVLVIPIADNTKFPGKMRQVAYVKPGATVVSVIQGNSNAKISLPKWMTSDDAKTMRAEFDARGTKESAKLAQAPTSLK